MADTPKPGETDTNQEPKNNVIPPVTPPAEDKNQATRELEEARKKAEQAEMRANQLANQLKTKEDADAAARTKELEEQSKFKDLYEQEKAKREQIESEKEEAERKVAIKAKSDELFKDYPEAVKELADDTGLTLADTDDGTVEAFKEKLERISKKVNNQKVTPNNPSIPTPRSGLSAQDMHDTIRDPKKFEEYVKKNTKGIAAMTRQTE